MPLSRALAALSCLSCIHFAVFAQSDQQQIPNHLIDARLYARQTAEAMQLRQTRRVSEEDFIRMARAPGTVVLDARSERLFDLLHLKGAVNLSFPEFTEARLAVLIPTKATRILIYCNNNFEGAPNSMPAKTISSALNLSTFVALYAYGYRNVYELGPVVHVGTSMLQFEGAEAGPATTVR